MGEQGDSLKASNPDNNNQMKECVHSLEFLNDKYDSINAYQSIVKQKLQRLSLKVAELAIKVDSIDSAIDDLQQYINTMLWLLGFYSKMQSSQHMKLATVC